MQLRGLADEPLRLRPFEVVRFDGARSVAGVLTGGVVKDFNVIFDAALCSADLSFREGTGVATCGSRATLLANVGVPPCNCEQGGESARLARHDAVLIAGDAGSALRWRDAERVALVRID